jgi:hypothetical protein
MVKVDDVGVLHVREMGVHDEDDISIYVVL